MNLPGGIARNGFTLIELLVTVAIVALLASMTVPMAEVVVKRNKEQELRLALRQIRAGIDAYRHAVDEGRIAKGADESGYPKRLAVLVEGVEDNLDPSKRKIYFLRRIPRNPFYEDMSIPAEETWGLRSYASPPDEPKEGDDVFDVYPLTNGVGLNDVPYREW
jgi:general secretion pathway protein G